MAKRRLSRLEFYGYRDQNQYTTFYDCGSNSAQRQDEAIEKIIEAIDGIDDDIDAISGAVDSLGDELDGIVDNIEAVSAATDENKESIDNANRNLFALSGIVGGHSSVLVQHGSRLNNLESGMSANAEAIEEIDGKLAEILGKDYTTMSEVDAIYAKKENVYTKDECDDKFLTEHQSLSGYVTHDEFDDVIGAITSGSTEALSGLTRRLAEIEACNESQDEELSGLTSAVQDIHAKDDEQDATIAEKAMQSDLEALSAIVSTMASADSVAGLKDDLAQVSAYTETLETKDSANTTKSTLENKDAELEDSISRLGADVSSISGTVASLSGAGGAMSIDILELREQLAQEKSARESGDSTLSGRSTDASSRITLYGVKKYAQEVAEAMATSKSEGALRAASSYTDSEIEALRQELGDDLTEMHDDFEGKLILKADTTAVTSSINSLRDSVAVSVRDAETRSKSYTDTRFNALMEDCHGYTDERYNALDVIVADLSTRLADLERKHDALCEEINCKFNTLLQQLLDGYDINIDLTSCNE